MAKNTGNNDGNHDKRQKQKQKAAALAAQQAAAVMSGAATAVAPVQTPTVTPVTNRNSGFEPGYNPSRSFVEVGPIDFSAFSTGLSNKFAGKINLPTTNMEGVSEGELSLMLNNFDKSLQYEADYGLRELQGQLDKELQHIVNENEQLKLDKTIDNSIWLDRTRNIAANRQQRDQSNAAMLANL